MQERHVKWIHWIQFIHVVSWVCVCVFFSEYARNLWLMWFNKHCLLNRNSVFDMWFISASSHIEALYSPFFSFHFHVIYTQRFVFGRSTMPHCYNDDDYGSRRHQSVYIHQMAKKKGNNEINLVKKRRRRRKCCSKNHSRKSNSPVFKNEISYSNHHWMVLFWCSFLKFIESGL